MFTKGTPEICLEEWRGENVILVVGFFERQKKFGIY